MKPTLHHVGVLVLDVRKAAAFYVERLSHEPKIDVIHDPTQSVYAQFFRLPTDRAYLELVSPDRSDSKLSNALKKGGGLNHVCYARDDIEAACSALGAACAFLIARLVSAVAFKSRRIAWLMGADRLLMELVKRGGEGEL